MILDTNVVILHIRKQIPISSRAVIPIVVVGELEAFALKADWGYQKMVSLNTISLYFDFELHSVDNDFDHLINFELKLVKPVI